MFALDIRGHINSLRLAESKALWPLFEAVVNSIQSIEDSPNRDNGKITIFAQREDQDPNLTIQKDVLERFESFVIEDNGNGMNTANYRSFNTAYSTLKIQKGCKGIGRFLWLKAFETVEIESVFQEDGQYYRRKFSFNPDGVSPENNLVEIDEDNIKTIVRLNNFATQYRHAAPVELDQIIDYAHFWNWAPDWNVVKEIYQKVPDSYSVLMPFAYAYLEEMIRTTTSDYGLPLFDRDKKPVKVKVGMALINLAKQENQDNVEYLELLEKAKRHFQYTQISNDENGRNRVMHGRVHPRFWSQEVFEDLIRDIAELSKYSKF